MVSDPYQVLGVERTASQQEIKSAYRKKAKEYHPDLHPNDPKAAAKMNEINEAYDMLQNPQKYESRRRQQQTRQSYTSNTGNSRYSQSRSSGTGGSQYRGAGGWYSDFGGFDFEDIFGFGSQSDTRYTGPEVQAGDSVEMSSAIRYINRSRYKEALDILLKMTSSQRNARWYYVCSAAYYGDGDTLRAQENIRRAMEMEPDNRTYSQQYRRYRQSGNYGQDWQRNTSPFKSVAKIAIGFIVLNFLMQLFQMLLYGARFM